MPFSLPVPSAGVNPWTFFGDVAHSAYYRPHPGSLRYRIIFLLALDIYVMLAALVFLGLTLTDYRRRGKKLWLWRLVDRPRGRYIVGNQQLLEPLCSIVVSSVFLAQLVDEYNVFVHSASQASTAALRLAPWTATFLQCWIVTWASLQSFILTNGERSRIISWITPRIANGLFVTLGVLIAIGLLIPDIISSRQGLKTWRLYLELQAFYASKVASWAGGALSDEDMRMANTAFDSWLENVLNSIDISIGTLAAFIVCTLLTSFINMGSLLLIVILRRQIKVSLHNNFRSSLPVSFSAYQPTSLPELRSAAASFAIHVPPITPDQELLNPLGGRGIPEKAVKIELPEPTTAASSKRLSATVPSRSDVRILAASNDGIRSEHAKNLSQLQRAESDLIITGLSSTILTFGVAMLCLWLVIGLKDIQKKGWYYYEALLFSGIWIYGFVFAVALTLHCYTAWSYMVVSNYNTPDQSREPSLHPGSRRGSKEPQNSFEAVLAAGPESEEVGTHWDASEGRAP